VAKMVLKRFDD